MKRSPGKIPAHDKHKILGSDRCLPSAAGANSMFYGDKLLTTDNPDVSGDEALLAKLGLRVI